MRNRKALGLLTASHGVNDFYQGAVPAVLPFLVAERGYSYALVTGITLAATGLASLTQPLFGVLTDRWPMRWLVAAGMLEAAVGLGVSGLADSYAWTWAAIAVCGLGSAAYHPAAAKAARAVAGGSTRAMSNFSVGGMIGTAVAPLAVAFVLDGTGMSGTWLLVLPAVVMALVMVAALLLTRRAGAAAGVPGAARSAVQPAGRDDWRAFGRLSALSVCWSIPYVVVGSFVALDVITRFHVSASTGAATLTAFTAGGVVGTLAGGRLAERRGRIPTIRLGYLGCVPAAVGVVVVPHIAGVLICALVLGTAMFVPFAAQITLAQDYLPNRVGTASGVTLGLTLSAGGLLSPLFGVIADGWGVTTVLATTISVLAVGAGLARLLTDPDQPRRYSASAEQNAATSDSSL
ncbi:MFS transporter [Pseudonocardia nigra]|uniref:MFS transporter n=1 Tax=Pseudonocardia nigra TaxID=1921578 RepID=UPI001C5F5E50|nr:MFS transporter [Pseudonocardia nigra]